MTKRIQVSLSFLLLCFVSCTQPEQESSKPNILFAIMDDASYTHMSAYGCEWVDTPNFDRIAREGILFTNAYTPNAKCAPSRASILTGRNSWQLEEAANHWCYFPEKFTTYAEVLDSIGYHVGYTGKGWAPGIAMKNGAPRNLTGTSYSNNQMVPPTSNIASNDYAKDFDDFLGARNDDQPFCFWFGSKEPHRGYEYGSGMRLGNRNLSEIDSVFRFWPDTDSVRNDLLDYAFEIEYFDKQLGKMLDMLVAAGELDNTLILVTSDNGMPFPRIKGQEYELSNHMPLAVMWKDGIEAAGRVVDDFVSFIDFAPTFLEIAGVKTSAMKPIQGRSLMDIFLMKNEQSGSSERDHVLIGKERHDIGRPNDEGYPIRGIVKGDYLLIQNFETNRWPAGNPVTGYLNCDGSPTKTAVLNSRSTSSESNYWQLSFGLRPEIELYNIRKDPLCMKNLAEDSSLRTLLHELREQMVSELTAQNDPRILGNGEVFDSYTYAHEANTNFYERFMNGEKMNTGWVNDSDFEESDDLKIP